MAPDIRCPCLSGEVYGACCGRYHSGAHTAPTAEVLMRSRYSAFALGLERYLLNSWHPSTRPDSVDLDDETRWTRLDIEDVRRGGPTDSEGVVRFTAIYRDADGGHRLTETSRFVRESGVWFYVDGIHA
ncbi:YchJ family protein [Leifsonia sp. ALI-44-B]|uniref:YchJ family protein n=1 Tax=Leifsonia sp. ALI-44-B TaxID=1933776 RepID=UPI001EE695FC|nr:YchJ family protein [Leifsonia sp. ALI-44-B]